MSTSLTVKINVRWPWHARVACKVGRALSRLGMTSAANLTARWAGKSVRFRAKPAMPNADESQFAYGAVGEYPLCWDGTRGTVPSEQVEVLDADTDEPIEAVIWCDARNGVAERYVWDGPPADNPPRVERITGRFKMRVMR